MAYLRAVVRCSLSPKCGNLQQSIPAASSAVGRVSFKSTHAASAVPQYESEQTADPASGPRRDPLDITFQDSYAAFKSKTTWEVVRAYIVYTLCSSEYLVENNMKVSKTVFNSRHTLQIAPGAGPLVPILYSVT